MAFHALYNQLTFLFESFVIVSVIFLVELTSLESSDESEKESSIVDEIPEKPKTSVHGIAVFVDVSHVLLLGRWIRLSGG